MPHSCPILPGAHRFRRDFFSLWDEQGARKGREKGLAARACHSDLV